MLVLGDGAVPKSDIPEAKAVTFGEEGGGVRALVEKAQARGYLEQRDASTVSELAQAAAGDGFPLAVRLGDTQMYAVYNAKNQYVPGAWAYVRTANVAPAPGAERSSSSEGRKGVSTAPRFMCKVMPCCKRWGGGILTPNCFVADGTLTLTLGLLNFGAAHYATLYGSIRTVQTLNMKTNRSFYFRPGSSLAHDVYFAVASPNIYQGIFINSHCSSTYSL